MWLDGDTLVVEYTAEGDWCLQETHVHVASSPDGIPQRRGNPIPELFEYSTIHDPCVKTYVYRIPLKPEWKNLNSLVVATQAVVYDPVSCQVETVWTRCSDFPGKDWAGYCTFQMPKEVITQWDVNVGYEDLPIAVSDYDYNDWLAGMDGELTYCSIGGEIKGLDHIEVLINPQSRGAAYDHIFHIRFAIVHGDYRLGNMAFDPAEPGRVVAVFDWEMATLGDPLADLGYTLIYWKQAGDPSYRRLPLFTDLPGFPTRAEIVEAYAKRSGRDVARADFYQVLALTKLAVISEGIYARHLAGKTLGPGFDAMRREAQPLAVRALELAAASPDARLGSRL